MDANRPTNAAFAPGRPDLYLANLGGSHIGALPVHGRGFIAPLFGGLMSSSSRIPARGFDDFPIVMQAWFLEELLDDGWENAIQDMIVEGGVNALLVGTHLDAQTTSDWGPLPHNPAGKSALTTTDFLMDIDPAVYADCAIKPRKTSHPRLRGIDAFAETVRAANELDVRTYALFTHRFSEVESYPGYHMRAVNGEMIPAVLCHHQPEVRKYYRALIKDVIDRYPELDGFAFGLLDHYAQYGFEALTDELAATLGIQRFSAPEFGLSCFCDVCVERAADQGIDVERVRANLLKGVESGWIPHRVERMTDAGEAFRFAREVPAFVEWFAFRSSLMTEFHTELSDYAHSLRPDIDISLDIYGPNDDWKYQSDFAALSRTCSWIKPMFYSGTYPGIAYTPERIAKETMASREAAAPGVKLLPGVSCLADEPGDKIRGAIEGTLAGGADGVVLSWDWALVSYENLRAARDTLREAGKIDW